MEYDIKVHTWWESRIRKISITSEENKLKIWFVHFGERVDIPTVNLDIMNVKGEKDYSKKVHSKEEFLESFREAFDDK